MKENGHEKDKFISLYKFTWAKMSLGQQFTWAKIPLGQKPTWVMWAQAMAAWAKKGWRLGQKKHWPKVAAPFITSIFTRNGQNNPLLRRVF